MNVMRHIHPCTIYLTASPEERPRRSPGPPSPPVGLSAPSQSLNIFLPFFWAWQPYSLSKASASRTKEDVLHGFKFCSKTQGNHSEEPRETRKWLPWVIAQTVRIQFAGP